MKKTVIISLLSLVLCLCSCSDKNSSSDTDSTPSSSVAEETSSWDDSLYIVLPKEGTEEYEKEKEDCKQTLEYLNGIKDGSHIIDIEDNAVWLSVTVEDQKNINSLELKLNEDEARKCITYVHPPLQEVVPEAPDDGKPVTDYDKILKLIKKYKYELGVLNAGYSWDDSEKTGVEVETVIEVYVEPLKEYLEACNVDMSLVKITPQYRRINT